MDQNVFREWVGKTSHIFVVPGLQLKTVNKHCSLDVVLKQFYIRVMRICRCGRLWTKIQRVLRRSESNLLMNSDTDRRDTVMRWNWSRCILTLSLSHRTHFHVHTDTTVGAKRWLIAFEWIFKSSIKVMSVLRQFNKFFEVRCLLRWYVPQGVLHHPQQ